MFITDYHEVDPADYVNEDLLYKKGFDADRWIKAQAPEKMKRGEWIYIATDRVYADLWTEAHGLDEQYDRDYIDALIYTRDIFEV